MDWSQLDQAKLSLEEGRLEECLAQIKSYWIAHPFNSEAASLLSALMKEQGRFELSARLKNLSSYMSGANTADSLTVSNGKQELFEAGFSLIDVREYDLAEMLLSRCVKLIPEEPLVNYELGFALMSMKRFEDAIPYFQYTHQRASDFDTLLNLTICYTMCQRLGEAQKALDQLERLELDPEQATEVAHRRVVLKRLEQFKEKTKLDIRDWLYILYGSVLLRKENIDPATREDDTKIGAMLAILKGVLEGLRFEPEAIEYYGPQSRPLAQALAELMEIPLSSYTGPDRVERALLTMTWATDIIGPHESFSINQSERGMFAYALPWHEPLPIVPDIVGCLKYDEPMPWQENTSPESSSSLDSTYFETKCEKRAKAIIDIARDLESEVEIIQAVQEALNYYENKRGSLVLANSRIFPNRYEYTAEIRE